MNMKNVENEVVCSMVVAVVRSETARASLNGVYDIVARGAALVRGVAVICSIA